MNTTLTADGQIGIPKPHAGANQITDGYLVALAREHSLTLATLDEALASGFATEPNLVQLIA